MIHESDLNKQLRGARAATTTELKQSPPVSHGLVFTLTMCIISLAIGVVAGMAADGTLEVVNAYKIHQLTLATQAAAAGQRQKPAAASVEVPAELFPDNNMLEWSTSLAPGERPAPLDVLNESPANNRRVLFYALGKFVPRLTATLYVRAGQKALIHLPLGRYRVDVASTPVNMPWEKARAVVAVPSYTFALPADDQESVPTNRLVVSAEGNLSFFRLSPVVIGKTSSDHIQA